MIWLLTLAEYLDKAVKYFRKTGDYLPEIRQLLKGTNITEKDSSLKIPSEENVRGLAAAIHKIAVITAWKEENKIPADVLKDYPWLRGEKPELPRNTYEYSFQKTDFGSAENFKAFLKACTISMDYKICRQFPLMEELVCYLWQGENIRIVTVGNPLKEKGLAHLIVMQGEMSTVVNAAIHIQRHTGTKGEEGLYFVDFTELYCSDPEEDDLPEHSPDNPDDNAPNVYELKKFGEFLSEHPLNPKEIKGGTSDADFNLYRLPWEMTYSEFSSHVKSYTKRFHDYPIEVWEVLGILIRQWPEMEKVLRTRPNVALASELASPIHIIQLTRALIQGKRIPSKVLKDYPNFEEVVLKRGPVPSDMFEYGFDATDFKSPEIFKEFLRLTGLSPKYQVCHYMNMPESPAVYLWEGKDINMITASNPLLTNGYASFIGIAGKKEKVTKAVTYIEEHKGSKASQGLEYIGFRDILCVYPDLSTHTGSANEGIRSNPPDAVENNEGKGKKDYKPEADEEQPVTEDKPEKQSDEPGSSNEPKEEPSGLSQLENIEKALKAGHSFEAANIVIAMAEEMEAGSNIGLLPHIIKYKQHRDLRRELSRLELEEIITSEKFREALSTNLWNFIPEEYKTIRTIKPITWNADPSDKGLRLLLADFVGHNEFRRAFLGANFDGAGIAATDAHKLIFINKTNLSKKGIYCINKFCFKALRKEGAEEAIVEENFPDYVKVLPENVDVVLTVHADTIRIFCSALRKAKLLRSRDPAITFCYADEKFIGINIEYLESCAEAFLRLGYSTFDIGFIAHDKAILITRPGKTDQVTSLATSFILLMPSVLSSGEGKKPQNGELYFDLRDEHVVTKGIEERIGLEDKAQLSERIAANPKGESKKAESEKPDKEKNLYLLSDDNWFKQHSEKVIASPEEIETKVSFQERRDKGEATTEETKPKTTSSTEDYIDKVVAVMHDKYARGERATKKQIEQLAEQLSVSNQGKLWEAVELSWLLWYKMLYKEPGSFETRLSKMIHFWNNVQPTYAYSDSSKEIYKQYSTPCPIAAIVAEYTGMRKAKSGFEPSAGNGLLVLGADPSRTHVNEIDQTRVDSLKFQGFQKITTLNAAHPFPDEMSRKYDVVVTNPPFTKWEDDQFDKDYLVRKYFHNHAGLNRHLRLEHMMAGLALHTMKDDGKAAIIIMGHLYFLSDGYIGKYRPFFNWLYRHFHVDDVINMNSFKLYNRQGAVERTMLILISGRKAKSEGVAPNKNEAPHLEQIVNTFEDLWARVRSHMPTEIDIIIHQLKIALAA